MPIRLIETGVIDLVEGALKGLRAQAEHKGIQIEVQIPGEPCALADATGVRKVLNNLLHSAIKFTPAQGHTRTSAHPVDDSIQIEISNTGCGIPACDLMGIFERFYKADPSRTASGARGSG